MFLTKNVLMFSCIYTAITSAIKSAGSFIQTKPFFRDNIFEHFFLRVEVQTVISKLDPSWDQNINNIFRLLDPPPVLAFSQSKFRDFLRFVDKNVHIAVYRLEISNSFPFKPELDAIIFIKPQIKIDVFPIFGYFNFNRCYDVTGVSFASVVV